MKIYDFCTRNSFAVADHSNHEDSIQSVIITTLPLSIYLWQHLESKSSSATITVNCSLGKALPYVVEPSSKQTGCGVLTRNHCFLEMYQNESTPNPLFAMVEDYFCSSCREGLSEEYSALRSYAIKNSFRVHRYHSDVQDYLDAIRKRCFVCTAVWKSLCAEFQATCLQGNTSNSKSWDGIYLDMGMCGDQPPSLLARVRTRDCCRDCGYSEFTIVPFTGNQASNYW